MFRSPVVRVAPLAFLATLATLPTRLAAQAGPRTIAGTVVDSTGRPLENAVVSLDPSGASRAVRVSASGRFVFDRVSPGRHVLRTTWLGYVPDERAVEVSASGAEVAIVLVPLPYALDTLRITVRRTGITGIVFARSDLRPLGDAAVEVLGTRHRTRSGTDGTFSLPNVREGAYVVSVKRPSFRTRILPVPAPKPGEAVELFVALDSLTSKAERLVENRMRDLEGRVHRRSSNSTAIVPRHELAAHPNLALDAALRYAPSFLLKGMISDGNECVILDGIASSLRLKDIRAGDVKLVEYYGPGNGQVMRFAAVTGLTSTCQGEIGSSEPAPVKGEVPGWAIDLRPRGRRAAALVWVWTKF